MIGNIIYGPPQPTAQLKLENNMIRMMGLIDFGKSFTNEAELTAKQKQLDVDKDGTIEQSDLEKLRKNETHGGDHEVSMAHNLLDDVIKSATELKAKMGASEKDIPAWIQDHISQAQNFINQAATNYHEYDAAETTSIDEKAPAGLEGTVKTMKSKGYQSHKKEK